MNGHEQGFGPRPVMGLRPSTGRKPGTADGRTYGDPVIGMRHDIVAIRGPRSTASCQEALVAHDREGTEMREADKEYAGSVPEDLLAVVTWLVDRFGDAGPADRLAALNIVLRLSLTRSPGGIVIPPSARRVRRRK